MVESNFELFSFKKDHKEGIYSGVSDEYEDEFACQKDILLLQKLVNTKLGEALSEKDREQLKNNAVGKFTDPGTVEHVMEKFCILLEGKLRPEIPGTSGLSYLYGRLPIKPEKEIKDMMKALVNQYENSRFNNEVKQAERYKALLNEEYISIMDALDAVFLTTFTREERKKLGNGTIPALQVYHAIAKDKPKSQLETFLNLLVGKTTEWPGKTIDYAFVWVCRNLEVHEGQLGPVKEAMLKKGYWGSLLDCCARYEKEISERFWTALIELIDPEKFKKKLENAERMKFFEGEKQKFTPLKWMDSSEFKWPKEGLPTVMLLGEAGAGKTTQMEKVYWEVVKSDDPLIPIWVQIKDLPDVKGTNKLMGYIEEKLEEFGGLYEEIMQEGIAILFLDGLNELLVDDNGATKRQLLSTIEDIRTHYKNVKICMTDRHVDISTESLGRYRCAGMGPKECKEYCQRNFEPDEVKEIMDYFDTDKHPRNKWVFDSREPLTPEKLKVLGDMIVSGKAPKIKEMFDYQFVHSILERERTDKREYENITILKGMLHELVEGKEYEDCVFYGNDIKKFFRDVNGFNDGEAIRFLNLALRIPLLVETKVNGEGGMKETKYKFAHYSYFYYFKRKDIV